uniref:Uncharacterized protein n=1 Tax=Anguilla anguilla TaxID=7936 RepID=A0A0E9TFQ2_ANGAN
MCTVLVLKTTTSTFSVVIAPTVVQIQNQQFCSLTPDP